MAITSPKRLVLLQKRRQKFLAYQNEVTEVVPGLFASGQSVVQNLKMLQQMGITHVINCLGPWAEEYREEFIYLSLNLDGKPLLSNVKRPEVTGSCKRLPAMDPFTPCINFKPTLQACDCSALQVISIVADMAPGSMAPMISFWSWACCNGRFCYLLQE